MKGSGLSKVAFLKTGIGGENGEGGGLIQIQVIALANHFGQKIIPQNFDNTEHVIIGVVLRSRKVPNLNCLNRLGGW